MLNIFFLFLFCLLDSSIIFVKFPQALSLMPAPSVWAVLFFLMMLFLSMNSQVSPFQALPAEIPHAPATSLNHACRLKRRFLRSFQSIGEPLGRQNLAVWSDTLTFDFCIPSLSMLTAWPRPSSTCSRSSCAGHTAESCWSWPSPWSVSSWGCRSSQRWAAGEGTCKMGSDAMNVGSAQRQFQLVNKFRAAKVCSAELVHVRPTYFVRLLKCSFLPFTAASASLSKCSFFFLSNFPGGREPYDNNGLVQRSLSRVALHRHL